MTAVLTRVPVRIPTQEGQDYAAVIVIASDGELTGLGEAPMVAGRSPAAALQGAEGCARLDLEARRRGVRLAELLGGVRREGVECSALITDQQAAGVAERVGRLAEQGYRCFKLKAANAGGIVDEERLGAARWAAGRDARLRLDFNGRLSRDDARSRLPSLQAFGVELFEQPLPAEADLDDWTSLHRLGLPVAADESLAVPQLAPALAAQGVALAAKVATVGGVEEAVALLNRARGAVTLGSSHETSIGIAAALHVACAMTAEPLACGLATRQGLAADLAVGLAADSPRLGLPDGPGLGVDLDPDALARYRVDK